MIKRIQSLSAEKSDRLYWQVAAFSLLIRILLAVYAWNLPFTTDAQDYVIMAGQLADGVRFIPYWPPGLPLYLLPFVKAGASAGVLRLAMIGFWIILVLALYRAAKLLRVERVAWLLLLVFSLTPAAIHLSITPLTQLPVAALLLVTVSGVLGAYVVGTWSSYLLAGIAIGATTLVRPSAAVLLLLIAIPMVSRRAWLRGCSAALIALAMLGGWMVKSHQLSDAWVFNTANTRNLWLGNNPDTPMYRTWYFGSHAKPGTAEIEAFPAFKTTIERTTALTPLEQQKAFQILAKDYITTHPGAFLVRTANRARCYWGFDTFTALAVRHIRPAMFAPVLLFEALLYCAMIVWTIIALIRVSSSFWKAQETWILVCSVLLYAAPYWISMSHPTYHFPVIVPLILAGAYAHQSFRLKTDSTKILVYVCLGLFALIQLEWVLQMARHTGA